MNYYLFTIGLGVKDEPERWTAICEIYARLAVGLTKLGHKCSFLVNPAAYDARALRQFEVVFGDHEDLRSLIVNEHPDVCLIWGGRIEPDIRTIEILTEFNIPCVFSELGWFPQRGTVYFDANGTNSKMSWCQPEMMSKWESLVFGLKRAKACRKIYGRGPRSAMPATEARRVFVPLQDETDTNILNDSPFLRMNDMLGFLSRQYPDCEFTARVHPKAPPTHMSAYPNVTVQDREIDLYKALSEFDLVIGINSTVISEAVFLGHPAMCFGDGIAKTYGLAKQIDPRKPPRVLKAEPEDQRVRNALAHLYLKRQLDQRKLNSPRYLKRSLSAQLLTV